MSAFTKWINKNLDTLVIGVVSFLSLMWYSFQFTSYAGGADNFSHFYISQHAWQDPKLLFDHWGKPLFTILTSPFAQFGFTGIIVFQCLVSAFTVVVINLALKAVNNRKFFFLPLLLFSVPLYIFHIPGALTENLFGLCSILIILAHVKKKFSMAMIFCSLLFLIRTEGIFFIPVYGALLLYLKEYKSLVSVLYAPLFFSLVGGLVLGDILWIYNDMPYSTSDSIYGNGPLFHFVEAFNYNFGPPLVIFGFLSSIGIFLALKEKSWQVIHTWLLCSVLVFTYFFIHTMLWYFGLGGSAGLIRVLAAIVPLMVFSVLIAWSQFKFSVYENAILTTVGLVIGISAAVEGRPIPKQMDDFEKAYYLACNQIESHGNYNKVYFYNPIVPYYLGVSKFDSTKVQERINSIEKPSENLEQNAWIVYDNLLGKNEGKLPLYNLLNSDELWLESVYRLSDDFILFDKDTFTVYLFRVDTSLTENVNRKQLRKLLYSK